MNSEGIFGKAGTLSVTLRAGDDGTTVKPDSIVSLRLYSDKPTQSQQTDHNNSSSEALQYITSWTDGTSNNEKLVNYAAISDPDPDLLTGHDVYYWILSYKLEDGGATLYTEIPFIIHRVEANTSVINVTSEDVYEVESSLEKLFNTKVNKKIKLASDLVERRIIGMGYDLKRVKLEDIALLVRYKATILCCSDLQKSFGDEWREKAKELHMDLSSMWKTFKFTYDEHKDGVSSPGESVVSSASVFTYA